MYASFMAQALRAMARLGRTAVTVHAPKVSPDGIIAKPDLTVPRTWSEDLAAWLRERVDGDDLPPALAQDPDFQAGLDIFLDASSPEHQALTFPSVYSACLSEGALPETLLIDLDDEGEPERATLDAHLVRLLRAPGLLEGTPAPDFWREAGIILADAMADGLTAHPGRMGPGSSGEGLLVSLSEALESVHDAIGHQSGGETGRLLRAVRMAAQTLSTFAGRFTSEADRLSLEPDALETLLVAALHGAAQSPLPAPALPALLLNDALATLARGTGDAAHTAEALALVLDGQSHPEADDLSPAARARLTRALFALAARRPDLFAPPHGSSHGIAAACFAEAAGLVTALTNPTRPLGLDGGFVDLALGLMEEAIAVLADQADALARRPEQVPVLLGQMTGGALSGIAQGLSAAGGDPDETFRILLGTDQARECAGFIMADLAATPASLFNAAGLAEEVAAVLAGLIEAMGDDTGPRLSRQDWAAITVTLAEETARNPGTLFTLAHGNADEGALGPMVITAMLKGAAKDLNDVRSLRGGGVSFGATLAEAITIALAQAASLGPDTAETVPALTDYVARIDRLARDGDRPIGATEWLLLFKAYLVDVLEGEPVPAFDDDEEIERVIFGG